MSGQPRWDPESLTRSHDLAAGLRPDAEGWVGSHSRPAPWQPSSAGKADCVPDQRSRLRKAFDGVFVTSKHGTAVKMGAMGLLVDLLFRVTHRHNISTAGASALHMLWSDGGALHWQSA